MRFIASNRVLYFKIFGCLFLIQHSLLAKNSLLTNGAQVYAYPVKSITIDGKADDWSNAFKKHPIAIAPYGRKPKKKDFEAHFRVGHNLEEKSLYLLIEIVDDEHIVDTSEKANWYTQDSYSLYIDSKHHWNGSKVRAFQFGENFKQIDDGNPNPNQDTENLTWENVEVKMSRSNDTTIYELKIMLGNDLKLNKTIGLDHVIVDADGKKGDVSFISWGTGRNKTNSSLALGDIIPVATNTKIAEIRGKVSWQDESIKKIPDRVTFINKEAQGQWTIAELNKHGNYKTMLPEGSYFIKPFWSFRDVYRVDIEGSESGVEVRPNGNIEAPDFKLKSKKLPDLIPEHGIIQDFDPNNPAKLDEFIKAYQDYYVIPGVSLAIIKEGKVVYHKTYGEKNTVSKEPVLASTLFEAASITKPVFAYAVCRLVEKGILELDRPLYTYLPFEEIAHDKRYQLITARHVLSHQTGFPNWAWMNRGGKMEIKFTPGTAYGYSGEGFVYLQRVITKLTGKDIETILKEEVLNPLKLSNFYFSANNYLQAHAASGHYGRFPTPADLPQEPNVAYTMYTEALSFADFVLSVLRREGLKSDTYDELFSPQVEIDAERSKEGWEKHYGLGIVLENSPFGPAFSHSGSNGDFQCKFKIYTSLNAGFIIFTNSDRGINLYQDLDEFLISGKN